MSRPAIYSVFIVTLILIGAFFIFPILVTVKQAFVAQDGSFTCDYLMEVLNNPLYRDGLWNSLRMAVGSTALCSAAVAITVPDSPTPFTPSGFHGDGVSISWVSKNKAAVGRTKKPKAAAKLSKQSGR